MKDIKELKEVLDGIELLAVSGAKIAANGKIGPEDLMVVIDLLKDVEKLKDAFEGMKEIPAEIKDLKEEELIELGLMVFGIVKKVKEEISKEVIAA